MIVLFMIWNYSCFKSTQKHFDSLKSIYWKHKSNTKKKFKASDILSDVNIVNIKLFQIKPRVIHRQYQMKTSVVWIVEIYQVDYFPVKSQANVCLRGMKTGYI